MPGTVRFVLASVVFVFASQCVRIDDASTSDAETRATDSDAEPGTSGGGTEGGESLPNLPSDPALQAEPAVSALLDPSCQVSSCCTITPVISGTAAAQTLTGTVNAECLVALGGNDTINASGGNDQAFGGDGVDIVNANNGNDLVSGGVGADTLKGEANNDEIYGGRDNDSIFGGDGADTLYPGMGADTTKGEAGNDTVVVHDECELVAGESIDGGSGTDTLVIPTSLANVQAMGVTVTGFETITVNSSARCKAECRLPCSDVDPAFLGLADPTIWSVDGVTGVRFRRSTAAERAANYWLAGTYLVEDTALVNGGATGSSSLNVHLPISDSQVQRVQMTKTGSTAYVAKIERRVTATELQVSVTKPTINTYLQVGFNTQDPKPVSNAWIDLLTTSDGEILVEGAANGRRVKLAGSNPGWTISSVQLPSGQPAIVTSKLVAVTVMPLGPFGAFAWSQCPGGQSPDACGWVCLNTSVPCGPNDADEPDHDCNNDFDDDQDGATDEADSECNHDDTFGCDEHGTHYHHYESGESFALFADGRFCTGVEGTWFGELTKRGWEAEELLTEADNYGASASAHGEFRYLAGGCWVFDSVEDAHDCITTGSCPAFAASYPYKNAGTSSTNFYDNVWLDVGHGADHGLDDALHNAVALYYGFDGTYTNSNPNIEDMSCVGSECCGAAAAFPTCGELGASVAVYQARSDNLGGCIAETAFSGIAHEMGHTLGLGHEDIFDAGQWGFMKSSGLAVGPALGNANQTALENGLETAECAARPPGFEWVGPGECPCGS